MTHTDKNGKIVHTMANYDPCFNMTEDEHTKTLLEMAWQKFIVKSKLFTYHADSAVRLRHEAAEAEQELTAIQNKIKENPQP